MPKPKSIQINIPSPCSQSWDEMTPSGQGRFCGHCQKTVIDFTTWSDAALYQYFSKDTGHTCGRFLASQVDRPIDIAHQPHSRLYRMTIALGLTLLFSQTPQLLAQNRPPIAAQTTTNHQPDSTLSPLSGEIKGQVLDEKKEPLISAVVQVYQDGIVKGSVVTDFDGLYSIKQLEPGAYDLVVLYTGYDTVKINQVIVGSGNSTKVNFEMKQPTGRHLGGAINMGYRKPLIKRDYHQEETKIPKGKRHKKQKPNK